MIGQMQNIVWGIALLSSACLVACQSDVPPENAPLKMSVQQGAASFDNTVEQSVVSSKNDFKDRMFLTHFYLS